MSELQPYSQQVLPQGALDSTPSSGGIAIGEAVKQVGAAFTDYGETQQRMQVREDLSRVYKDTNEIETQVLTRYKDLASKVGPNDDLSALTKDLVVKTAEPFSGNYATRQAQQEFERITGAIKARYLQQAIGYQTELAVKDARNTGHRDLQVASNAAFNAPGQVEYLINEATAKIDNPEGPYSALSYADRNTLKLEYEQRLRLAAEEGKLRLNPAAYLSSVPPETSQKVTEYANAEADKALLATRYGGFIASAIKGTNVPAPLVQSLINTESSTNPNAVSKKGAAGLMQLMPATIKDCGISQEDAFDPEKNIACGVKFLSTLHSRYGTWDKALAAYNWGPGNLDKAISRDAFNWRGLLPPETKAYLDKLLPNAMGVPVAEATAASHPPVSIPNNDNFNRLPFEKQIDILNQAKTLANHASVENERLQRIHKEEVEKANDRLMTDALLCLEADGKDCTKSLVADPNSTLTFPQRSHLIALETQYAKGRVKQDPDWYLLIYNRMMNDPAFKETEINEEMLVGHLTVDNAEKLRSIYRDHMPWAPAQKELLTFADNYLAKKDIVGGALDPLTAPARMLARQFITETISSALQQKVLPYEIASMLAPVEGNEVYTKFTTYLDSLRKNIFNNTPPPTTFSYNVLPSPEQIKHSIDVSKGLRSPTPLANEGVSPDAFLAHTFNGPPLPDTNPDVSKAQKVLVDGVRDGDVNVIGWLKWFAKTYIPDYHPAAE